MPSTGFANMDSEQPSLSSVTDLTDQWSSATSVERRRNRGQHFSGIQMTWQIVFKAIASSHTSHFRNRSGSLSWKQCLSVFPSSHRESAEFQKSWRTGLAG